MCFPPIGNESVPPFLTASIRAVNQNFGSFALRNISELEITLREERKTEFCISVEEGNRQNEGHRR